VSEINSTYLSEKGARVNFHLSTAAAHLFEDLRVGDLTGRDLAGYE